MEPKAVCGVPSQESHVPSSPHKHLNFAGVRLVQAKRTVPMTSWLLLPPKQ